MSNWKAKWGEVRGNIKARLEKVRRVIDSEREDVIPIEIEQVQKNKLESEHSFQKLLNAADETLKREITRLPNIGKAYVPVTFVVFLSEAAEKSLSREKREFFEQGLSAILLERAAELAGKLELTAKEFKVKIAVNGILTDDEIEVRALSENARNTVDSINRELEMKTFEKPEKKENIQTIEDSATIEDYDSSFDILYSVEIWQDENKLNEFPIILRQNTIGRDDGEMVANLRLPTDNRKISRIHAEIVMEENGELWITSLHKNPTIVSGKVIRNGEKAQIGSDGEIRIYDFLLKLKFKN